MDYNPRVRSVLDALAEADVPYMIVGALSANVYGVMRATNDADIVVELSGRRVSEVTSLLGPEFVLDPQVAFDSVTASYRHIIALQNSTFKIELFRLSKDPHDQVRFARRVPMYHAPLDRIVSMPTPEDVIIMKLRWAACLNRSKDRNDVREVMTAQQSVLDWKYIEHWTDQHGTTQLYHEIRSGIPGH